MENKKKNYLGVTFQSILLALGLYFINRLIRNQLYFPMIAPLAYSHPALYDGLRYLGHLIALGVLILYLLLVKNETHYLKEASFTKKGKDFLWLLLGLALGFAMNAIAIGAALLHGDIDMVAVSFNPVAIIYMFICVFIQSSTEEFQYRLWTHNRIEENATMAYATIGSAFAFMLSHMMNQGITLIAILNIILVGILYSIAYKASGSLWLACAMHCSWNFSQNCVFGLPNSGNEAIVSIMAPTYTNKSFFYDPVFGVEGTMVTTIITVVAIIIALIFYRKKKNNLKKQAANA